MIFAHTLEKVLSGEKTQTRRRTDGKRLSVGKTYAIQAGRGKKAVGRFLLKAMRFEPVIAISEQDAIAEGFAGRDEFLETWALIHGSASFDEIVCVLEFERVS